MPANLELKAACADPGSAHRTAHSIGARDEGILLQTDTYFGVPDGRLKLREIEGDRSELISYRRPNATPARTSRFEICPVEHPLEMIRLLELLFGIRCVVRKKRSLYLLGATRIHIDEVEGLGSFIEFEIPRGDTRLNPEEMLDRLVKEFGIGEEDVIRHSYVDMMEQKREKP
jgi:predicted adenylyl cyclase CyaB